MKRILVSLIVITCFFNPVSLAQKKSAKKSPCSDNETQAGANACARYEYDKAVVEMNEVYQHLMSELAEYDDKARQKLRQAQLLWLQYRNANCESEAAIYEGGSIRPAVYSHCLASVTQERTRRMKAFIAEAKM
jgi:uncharacterized protein YecT (DUF1311 family)